jgi:enoyl-CoA hydratase
MFNNDSNNLQYWKCAGPGTTITLNRPECHNALDREVSAELNAVVKEISVDRGCCTVILRGGCDTFCARVMT